MTHLFIRLSSFRWEDGENISKTLLLPDRWEIHSAEKVLLTLNKLQILVLQSPTSIPAKKVGVGAVLWDGCLALAAYLVTCVPHHRFVGARIVELGAGVGTLGIALGMLGAHVTVTDISKVIPLLKQNLEANGFPPTYKPKTGSGWVTAEELEWGKPGWMNKVSRLADPPLDYVLAADCCYIDGDGDTPSTLHFVETLSGLCSSSRTRCLVASEQRAEEVRVVFLEEAGKRFSKVERISPLPPPFHRIDYIDLWELTI